MRNIAPTTLHLIEEIAANAETHKAVALSTDATGAIFSLSQAEVYAHFYDGWRRWMQEDSIIFELTPRGVLHPEVGYEIYGWGDYAHHQAKAVKTGTLPDPPPNLGGPAYLHWLNGAKRNCPARLEVRALDHLNPTTAMYMLRSIIEPQTIPNITVQQATNRKSRLTKQVKDPGLRASLARMRCVRTEDGVRCEIPRFRLEKIDP